MKKKKKKKKKKNPSKNMYVKDRAVFESSENNITELDLLPLPKSDIGLRLFAPQSGYLGRYLRS